MGRKLKLCFNAGTEEKAENDFGVDRHFSLYYILFLYSKYRFFLIALVLQYHLIENVKEGWMNKAAEPQTYT